MLRRWLCIFSAKQKLVNRCFIHYELRARLALLHREDSLKIRILQLCNLSIAKQYRCGAQPKELALFLGLLVASCKAIWRVQQAPYLAFGRAERALLSLLSIIGCYKINTHLALDQKPLCGPAAKQSFDPIPSIRAVRLLH